LLPDKYEITSLRHATKLGNKIIRLLNPKRYKMQVIKMLYVLLIVFINDVSLTTRDKQLTRDAVHRDFVYHDDHLNTILDDEEMILDFIRY
jgi:hypothetical protein